MVSMPTGPLERPPNTQKVENSKNSDSEGGGPNLIQKIYSIGVTIIQLISGWSSKDAMKNRGRQIGSPHFRNFVGKLAHENKFHLIGDCLEGPIKFSNAQKIRTSVQRIRNEERILNQETKPIFIPLVVGNRGLFEVQHIVGLVIDPINERIEYFDSKGITAEKRKIDDEHSMQDFINTIKKETFCAKFKEIQNNVIHQLDIHNCGAYVGYYAKKRFKSKRQAEDIMSQPINKHSIKKIRNEMTLPSW